MIRVLIADDHTIVRQGLVSLLRSSGEIEIVAEAAGGLEAVERALATRPDVAVVDLSMPRLSGLEAVRRIRAQVPGVRILVLTVHEDRARHPLDGAPDRCPQQLLLPGSTSNSGCLAPQGSLHVFSLPEGVHGVTRFFGPLPLHPSEGSARESEGALPM